MSGRTALLAEHAGHNNGKQQGTHFYTRLTSNGYLLRAVWEHTVLPKLRMLPQISAAAAPIKLASKALVIPKVEELMQSCATLYQLL